MDGAIVGAIAGMVFLTVVNVSVVAYTYGKLTQKVIDLCDRVRRLEENKNTARGG